MAEQINLRPVDIRTGAAQQMTSLADRLGAFQQEFRSQYVERNKKHEDAYLSTLSNDIRDNVNKLQAEHSGIAPGDDAAFKAKADAYAKGVLGEVEGFARDKAALYLDDVISAAGRNVTSTSIKAEDKRASMDIEKNINDGVSQSATYALDGNLEGALINTTENVYPFIDSQVERGELSLEAAEIKKNEIFVGLQGEMYRGEIRTMVQNNDYLGAMKAVQKFQELPLEGVRDDQKNVIYKSLVAEMQGALSLQNKLDAEEDRLATEIQEENAITLSIAQYSGSDITSDTIKGLAAGTISAEDGERLLSKQRMVGQGVDDWGIIYDIQQRIVNGESISAINRIIDSNAGSKLTMSTASDLLKMATASTSKNPRVSDPRYKAAKEYLNGMLAVRGILGQLDTESERRIATAEMELFKRAGMGGENPLDVVNELVDKTSITKAASGLDPAYGDANDLGKYKANLESALKNGSIDKQTFNYRYRQVVELENMISTSKVFDSFQETVSER